MFCTKVFPSIWNLKRHLETHYKKKFECYICKKKCRNLHNIQKHLIKHNYSSNNLNSQKKVKSKLKNCICKFCGKAFSRSWNLKRHENLQFCKKAVQTAQCDNQPSTSQQIRYQPSKVSTRFYPKMKNLDFIIGKIYKFSDFKKTLSTYGANTQFGKSSLMCIVNNKYAYFFYPKLQHHFRTALRNSTSETLKKATNYPHTSYWICNKKVAKDIPVFERSDNQSYELQKKAATLPKTCKPVIVDDTHSFH